MDDLKVLLRLVSERFAYVYSLMTMVYDWDGLETRVEKYQEDNPSSSSSAKHDLMMVRLWLERNQAGRALLLPSVAPTVPLGVWSLVLEKAGNSSTEAYQHDLPPLRGIFYVVQGLVQGVGVGISHDSTTTATRNNKKRRKI
jgi:hypothetical protein